MKRISFKKAEINFNNKIEIYYLPKGQYLKNGDKPNKVELGNFREETNILKRRFSYGDKRRKAFKLFIK
jgi:hypothetical protein